MSKILLLILLCLSNVTNSAETDDSTGEGDLTDVLAMNIMFENDTSAGFEQYGCKVFYEKLLLPLILRALQLSSLESLVFCYDDWRLAFVIGHDKFEQFVNENNIIDLKNIDIQKCKEGDVIYNTTIDLLYPFINVSIQYVTAKGHYEDNKCVNCVEGFFRTNSETSQVIMYKTFSEINNAKYIEFRTNYIKKLLKVKYNTLDIYSKQAIQYAENGREIIPENQYFLKIIDMIDQYGKSFF